MKYKKIAETPNGLEELLLLLNQLPKSVGELERLASDLVGISEQLNSAILELWGTQCEHPGKFDHSAFARASLRLRKRAISKITSQIGHDLAVGLNLGSQSHPYYDAPFYVRTLVQKKLALLHILQCFEMRNNDAVRYAELRRKITFHFVQPPTWFQFNTDTTIEITEFDIFDYLSKNRIPMDRVRLCPVCNEIYWVKRKGAPVCKSRKCSNAFHQRVARRKVVMEQLDDELRKLKSIKAHLGETSNSNLIHECEMRIESIQAKIISMK